jgi:neuronal guanine nucleotide exchange factor
MMLMAPVKKLSETKVHYFFLFNNLLVMTKKKREQYEVTLHTPCNRVGAAELSDAEIARRFPHGVPPGCQNLFLLTIVTDTGQTDLILATKLKSDMARWIEAFSSPTHDVDGTRYYEDLTDCPQVQVVSPFIASEPDELDLVVSDVVNVITKFPDGWYEGERIRDGKRGWFPMDRTIEIENQHVRMRNLRQQLRLIHQTAKDSGCFVAETKT